MLNIDITHVSVHYLLQLNMITRVYDGEYPGDLELQDRFHYDVEHRLYTIRRSLYYIEAVAMAHRW